MRSLALVFTFFAAAFASAEGVITFASVKEGGERISSQTMLLAGGRMAALAVVGANPATAKTEAEEEVKLVEFDPVTRLAILERPKALAEQPAVARGSALGLRQGDAVYLPAEKVRASRVVRWENTYREKVLPVALIRIHHPWTKPPLPGTPLSNEKGEVVAICHQPAPEFGNGTFALPIEVVTRIEKNLEAAGRLIPCWIGVTVNPNDPVLAIEMVRPGSPGFKAGVKKGDILIWVGPREVSSYADARNAFYYLVAGQETNLKLLRGTRSLELRVIPEVHPVYLNPLGEKR